MPEIINKKNTGEQLISAEVQEIISYHPHWIIRMGNVIFFLVLLIMLGLTFIIDYPDIIRANMKMVAVNAPKLISGKVDGKLQKLLVKNEQDVKQGDFLAFLQSTADYQQVIKLDEWIKSIEPVVTDSFDQLLSDALPQLNRLGEVQPAYEEFQVVMEETKQVLTYGYYRQKQHALTKDLEYLHKLQQISFHQKDLLKKDYELQEIEFKAKQLLAKDKVIAPLELNQDESKMIGKEQGLEQMSAQIINSDISVHNKQKEILELQKYISDQQQKFLSALHNLKSKVEAWIQQYILIAPQDGNIYFISFLQENQLLGTGQELMYVQSPQATYYGELMAGQSGLGKIKKGQNVIIRLEGYPSAEFGYLKGSLAYISNIPNNRDSFLIKVDLPHGLQTNYNKQIFFRNGLKAQAEIITDNRKLSERFWGQLKEIIKR